MAFPISFAQDGSTFTLAINGDLYYYAKSREGKRQAIIDGLNAIETVQEAHEVYLASNAALQLVATVLYPDGIKSEVRYKQLCQITEKASAHYT